MYIEEDVDVYIEEDVDVVSLVLSAFSHWAILVVAFTGNLVLSQVVYGPDRPPVHPPPQERMRPILFCSWDLSEHEKWMPPSPNWDGLPVGRHFQNGRHRN